MTITAEMVKDLRERTGAGVMDCKAALAEAQGDFDKAVEVLRKKGLRMAGKRAGRTAAEGLVVSYIHGDGKIGVLLELNCETDFVARTDQFRQLAKDLTLQVCSLNPTYVRREDVPPDVLEQEAEILRSQPDVQGKPPAVREKIVQGRLEKFYAERCLLDQTFVKDQGQGTTVGDLVKAAIGVLGENIVVRRFARFQLGEGIDR